MPISTAIVIPFYDGYQYIDRLLSSIDVAEASIIIVDNSPTARQITTPEHLSNRVEVIRTRPGIGFGRANNVGAFRALELGAERAIFTNQDGFFRPGSISSLIRASSSNDNAIVSAMTEEPETGSLNPLVIKLYLSRIPSYVKDLEAGKEARDFYSCGHPIGGCFLFPLSYLQIVGPFEPAIHMYREDRDLFKRCEQTGILMGINPKARFAHVHSNHAATGAKRRKIREQMFLSDLVLEMRNQQNGRVRTGAKRLLKAGARIGQYVTLGDSEQMEYQVERLRNIFNAMARTRGARDDNILERAKIRAEKDILEQRKS